MADPGEFSRDEIQYYLAHFYGSLRGFIEGYFPMVRCEPFVKAVRAKFTKELSPAQKARFLARVGARTVTGAKRTGD